MSAMGNDAASITSAPRSPGKVAERRENALPFWCLMLFTFVLLVAPQAYFPSLRPFRVALVSAGSATLAYLYGRLSIGRPLTIVTPEVRLVLWLVVLAVLSIPLSSWPGGSADYLLSSFLKSIILFFLVANVVDSVRRMKLLIWSIILWGIFLAVDAVQNYYAMADWAGRLTRIPGSFSPIATDPNDLALTLNLILSLTIGHYCATRNLIPRLLLLPVMALLAAGVVASFSRGGFLALVALLFVFAVQRTRQRGLAALALFVGLVLLALYALPEGYSGRIYSIYDIATDPTGSARVRWNGMVLGVTLMLENPLVGLGLAMHALSFPERGLGWQGIHSAFIQIGADLGVGGFLVYLLLTYHLFKTLWRSRARLREVSQNRELLGLAMGLETALASYVVGGFLLPVAYHIYLFYIGGLILAFQEIVNRVTADRPGGVDAVGVQNQVRKG